MAEREKGMAEREKGHGLAAFLCDRNDKFDAFKSTFICVCV